MNVMRSRHIGFGVALLGLLLSHAGSATAGISVPPSVAPQTALPVHMTDDVGDGRSAWPCPYMPQGYGMGMMPRGYMGMYGDQRRQMLQGRGMTPGSGMMYGGGMTGPQMGSQGMMGPQMGGPGMMGQDGRGPSTMRQRGVGSGMRVVPYTHLSIGDVRHFLEHQIEIGGNPRLKVGDVKEDGDENIVADIVTQDGALVDRFKVDRHSGEMTRVQ